MLQLLLQDFFLFQRKLSLIAKDFLLSLFLLVCLFLVVDLPALIHVLFLLVHAILSHPLLLLNCQEQFVSVQLLYILARLQMVLGPLLILHLSFILLPLDVFLANDELLVELFGLVLKHVEFLLDLCLFDLLGSARHLFHPAVRVFSHLHFTVQVSLV